jgi:hypothetical protein
MATRNFGILAALLVMAASSLAAQATYPFGKQALTGASPIAGTFAYSMGYRFSVSAVGLVVTELGCATVGGGATVVTLYGRQRRKFDRRGEHPYRQRTGVALLNLG